MKKIYPAVILFMLLNIFAGEPRKHDGFYLRLLPGFGSGYANYEDLFELNGPAGMFSIHFGGTVSENLILFGKVGSCSMTDPDVTVAGTFSFEAKDTTYDVTGIGLGVNYYMPENFYIAASIDFPAATIDNGGSEGSSDTGVGGELTLGKEWWVSDNWSLGVAATGLFSVMKDQDDFDDNQIGNLFFGILFSATYN
ncbi:MAG TPA: hypothetical protein PKW56_03065 [Clostridiales bacterium]|nr:hypothetical protein [Clostridiales bacterium]